MNSTAHVRPESEISLEQGVCCAVWGRQTTMQMRANQFLARSQSCSQHAVDSQSTTTAKDLQIQYKIKMYLYRSTCTVQLQDTRFIYEYSTSCTRPIRRKIHTRTGTGIQRGGPKWKANLQRRTYHLRGSAGGDIFSFWRPKGTQQLWAWSRY